MKMKRMNENETNDGMMLECGGEKVSKRDEKERKKGREYKKEKKKKDD